MDTSEYINLRTLSERLGIAPRTLRSWVSDHNLKLPAYKVKGCLLFNWAEVVQWLESYKITTLDMDAMVDEVLNQLNKGTEK